MNEPDLVLVPEERLVSRQIGIQFDLHCVDTSKRGQSSKGLRLAGELTCAYSTSTFLLSKSGSPALTQALIVRGRHPAFAAISGGGGEPPSYGAYRQGRASS